MGGASPSGGLVNTLAGGASGSSGDGIAAQQEINQLRQQVQQLTAGVGGSAPLPPGTATPASTALLGATPAPNALLGAAAACARPHGLPSTSMLTDNRLRPVNQRPVVLPSGEPWPDVFDAPSWSAASATGHNAPTMQEIRLAQLAWLEEDEDTWAPDDIFRWNANATEFKPNDSAPYEHSPTPIRRKDGGKGYPTFLGSEKA